MWSSKEKQIRQIMDEWQQELRRPDLITRAPQRISLLKRALELVSKNEKPVLWAELQAELGRTFAEDKTGDWGRNIRQAIEAYEKALTVQKRQSDPDFWVLTISSLADALCDLDDPQNKNTNIEKAISLYKEAAQIYSRQGNNTFLANTRANLATAYLDRIQGDRSENIEIGIELIKQSLAVLSKYNEPYIWAMAMSNLGIAYHHRMEIEPGIDNLEKSIECFQKSLEVTKSDPIRKAKGLSDIAQVYLDRIQGNRQENINLAIEYLNQALTLVPSGSTIWAHISNVLGVAYSHR